MYTPTVQTVRSGLRDVEVHQADVDVAGDAKEAIKGFSDNIVKAHEKKYQESTDFYDLQKEESESLGKALDGLEGSDYKYTMDKVVEARNSLAALFKGKKLKDYNTPEFQKQLLDIKTNLGAIRNGSVTSINGLKQAATFLDKPPVAFKTGAAKVELERQRQLPPDQRDPNILKHLSEDPQFWNGFELADVMFGSTSDTPFVLDNGSSLSSGVTKNRVGLYDANGSLIITDDILRQKFQEYPMFKKIMENAARNPKENKAMTEEGLSKFKEEDLFKYTKEYLLTVADLKNTDEVKGTHMKVKPITKQTSSQIKADELEELANNFHNSLKKDPEFTLNNMLVDKASQGKGDIAKFTWLKPDMANPNIITITPFRLKEVKKGYKTVLEPTAEDPVTINTNDAGQVRAVYNSYKKPVPSEEIEGETGTLKKYPL